MAVATRTPKQQYHDYLHSQVKIVNHLSANKRMHCKKCGHNFSGSITRIYDHLTSKAGDVKACTFSQTNDRRAVLDEIDALEYALPKGKKRKATAISDRERASSSGRNCERNWSTYDFITNRKRNKLTPARAQDLVYVHYNTRCELKSRKPEEFPTWLDEDVQLLPV